MDQLLLVKRYMCLYMDEKHLRIANQGADKKKQVWHKSCVHSKKKTPKVAYKFLHSFFRVVVEMKN